MSEVKAYQSHLCQSFLITINLVFFICSIRHIIVCKKYLYSHCTWRSVGRHQTWIEINDFSCLREDQWMMAGLYIVRV